MRKLLEGLNINWRNYYWDIDQIDQNIVFLGKRTGPYVRFSFDDVKTVIERFFPAPKESKFLETEYSPITIPGDMVEAKLIRNLIEIELRKNRDTVKNKCKDKKNITIAFILQNFQDIVFE